MDLLGVIRGDARVGRDGARRARQDGGAGDAVGRTAWQSAARARCDEGDLAACGALGFAATRTPAGGPARTASTWEAGVAALDDACAVGVVQACAWRARITMRLDPATKPAGIDPTPHRVLTAQCAEGEAVACLLAGDALTNGWSGAVDTLAAEAAWGTACAGGVPEGWATACPAPCVRSAEAACSAGAPP